MAPFYSSWMKHLHNLLKVTNITWYDVIFLLMLKIKMLVTEDAIRVEQKYKAEKEVRNFCNVFVGSNYTTTQFPFFENKSDSESGKNGRR
jgi:hypothetical protein